MKIKTKSQITLLMIVGLVLFIVVGLLFYLSKLTIKKPSQQNVKETQETAIEIQPIKEFITQCLDKTAKDSLYLLGKQGGYIYTDQGGTLRRFNNVDEGVFFVKHNKFDVAYNIKKTGLYAPQPYSTFVPSYPWPTFPYRSANSNSKTFEGIFGISNLPPLNASGGSHSIQTQMETYIDSNLPKCLDFTPFKDYDVVMEKSKTKIIIGSRDLSVKSEIPIRITNTLTKESSQLKDFSTNLNFRLKDFYYYARELIENDIGDIKFSIRDAKNNKEAYSVKVIENIYATDDLISVKDNSFLINSQSFEYVFARQNRIPALYFIKKSYLEFPEDYLIKKEDLIQDSELNAEDPDEDKTTITIKALLPNPNLPTRLDRPYIQFKVEASDGKYSDYQTITVARENA